MAGEASFALVVVTNRPHRLAGFVERWAPEARREGVEPPLVVIGTGPTPERVRPSLEKWRGDALWTSPEALRAWLPSGSPQTLPLEGRYGGARNAGLLACALLGRHAVFLDDDVSPYNDALARFQNLLGEGRPAVQGAYAGRAGGLDALLRKLNHAVTAFAAGKLGQKEALGQAREALQGLSDPAGFVRQHGPRGGCLGVSLQVLQRYGFWPTSLRMEDGVYLRAGAYYIGRDWAVYPGREAGEAEYFARTPCVRHEPEGGLVGRLVEDWAEAFRGGLVTRAIYALLEQGAASRTLAPGEFEAAYERLSKPHLQRFLAARPMEDRLAEAVARLGDPDLERAWQRLSSLGEAELALPPEKAALEARRFFAAQQAWPGLVEEAGREGWLAQWLQEGVAWRKGYGHR